MIHNFCVADGLPRGARSPLLCNSVDDFELHIKDNMKTMKQLLFVCLLVKMCFSQKSEGINNESGRTEPQNTTPTLHVGAGGAFGAFSNDDYVETPLSGGGAVDLGVEWGEHLLFGNFTWMYGYGLTVLGGGAGYMYSLVEKECIVFRLGAVVGFWGVNYYGYTDGSWQYSYYPMIGGPAAKVEFGKKRMKMYIQDKFLIGKGVNNILSAGIVLDMGYKK